MRILTLFIISITLSLNLACAKTKSIDQVPASLFQGIWKVVKKTVHLDTGVAPRPDEITEKPVTEEEIKALYFRRHKSGAVQQFEPSKTENEVLWSRGVNILELTETSLKWRRWSDHPAAYRKIQINKDGTATYTMFGSKFLYTSYLKKEDNKRK